MSLDNLKTKFSTQRLRESGPIGSNQRRSSREHQKRHHC
ncbi:hypothetical protein GYH30_050219 [Glycine max]|nr:hypothetical protein GYH30_050219 [Glycine max]